MTEQETLTILRDDASRIGVEFPTHGDPCEGEELGRLLQEPLGLSDLEVGRLDEDSRSDILVLGRGAPLLVVLDGDREHAISCAKGAVRDKALTRDVSEAGRRGEGDRRPLRDCAIHSASRSSPVQQRVHPA